MKRSKHVLILTVSILLISACSQKPTAVPVPDTPEPTPELLQAAPTLTPEIVESEGEDLLFDTEETKTTLLVYSGDARYSRDDGETWNLADTGLWLETGDRVQITEGGLALILFPDGSLIRLEGYTDFELVLCEFDFEAGTKRIIGRVWDGAALVSTLPLPNPDSLFQLWLMTTLIDLPFNPAFAVPLDQAETIPEEEWLSFGAAMLEDLGGEKLFNFADSVLPYFYALEMIDGDLVAIRTQAQSGQLSELFLPFRDNIQTEFTLEGMLDMAAGLINELKAGRSILEIDFYGYSIYEEGNLNETQTLFTLFPRDELAEFLGDPDPGEQNEYISYVNRHPAYKRHQLLYRYFKTIPDIFAEEILLMLQKYNLGCDIKSGLGCTLPEGCDRESGTGCELASGCNPVTRAGCEKARLSCIAYVNCDWAPCGKRPVVTHFCKPRVRTYCDPAVEGSCDPYTTLATSAAVLSDPAEETEADQDSAQDGEGGEDDQGGDSQGEDSSLTLSVAGVSIPLELVQNPELAGEPLYDPNIPAETAPFYNNDEWEQLIAYYRSLYGDFEDDDWDDEDIEWCTCTASHAGYPPPPPWMDMTYRCWCSDPGAY